MAVAITSVVCQSTIGPSLGDLDGGRHQIAPRLAAIAPVRGCQSGRHRRRHYGLGADRVDVADHHRPAEQVALVALVRQHEVSGIERLRRARAEVDAGDLCRWPPRRPACAPTPPMPLIQGSTTPIANAAATAASTACPPASSTRAPISDAARFCVTTMPGARPHHRLSHRAQQRQIWRESGDRTLHSLTRRPMYCPQARSD